MASILHSISLALLYAFFTPLCTFITILSSIISPFTKTSKHIKHHRQWRKTSSSTFRPRTVLVTGVGSAKGLTLARAFYRAGHRVLGADFEPYLFPVCGHFSASIDVFYRLSKPTKATKEENGTAEYILDIFSLVQKEKVELWVSCSDVAAVDEVEVAEILETRTNCKTVQFDHTLTETLAQIPLFFQSAKEIGLDVPEAHVVTSETEALNAIYPSRKSFLIRPIRPDGNQSSTPILLPPTLHEAESQIRALNPTPFSPFFMQEDVQGSEYKTYSLILHGKVKAFVSYHCTSTTNNITAVPFSSAISQALLIYTKTYISTSTTSPKHGHLSITFRFPPPTSITSTTSPKSILPPSSTTSPLHQPHAISAYPGISTGILLFTAESEDLAEAYLSILPSPEPLGIANGHRDPSQIIIPKPSVRSRYWIGPEVVDAVFGFCFFGVQGWGSWWCKLMDGMGRLVGGRDAVWEVWDPWPWWWLYVGYWPAVFVASVLRGEGEAS